MDTRTRTQYRSTVVTLTLVFACVAAAANAGEPQLLSALNALKSHVDGTAPLTASEIETHKLTIDANRSYFGNSSATISASFDLVSTYDAIEGPLWANGSTVSGTFYRNSVVNDIHWTMFNVMQNIVDDTYNSNNIATYKTLLDGYKFGSSSVFPGEVTPPADPNVTYTATINGSFPKTYGHDTMHWADRPARKPTGTYLAPGSIATVTVPQSLVNQGYSIRVGGNSWDFSNKNPIDRLDRVSLVYDIDSTEIEVANPLGGGIYVEVPYLADAGVVDVQVKNAVRSPFFSAKSFDSTTLSEWLNTERDNPAPWADFQSEKFMMHVPSIWIRNLSDPVTLIDNWDKAIDVTNDLMGFPHDRGKESMFPSVDVRLRVGAYSPGYPSINATYNPKSTSVGSNSHLIRGPQYAPYYEFHELGHGYLFQKFPGETESNVNLLHVAVWNRAFGYDLDVAFEKSMNYNVPYRTLDTTSVCWMMTQNFKLKQPMEKIEKQYQLKGHAKFVEIARLYGWDVLGDYWKSFNDDYENNVHIYTDIDSLLLRLSKNVGVDVTPLFHFWGVHPQNLTALQAAIDYAGVPDSPEIYETLLKYKSFIPADNTAYRNFARNWWGGKQPSPDGYTTERDHAAIWDTYDEEYAALIESNVQELIDLYFPEGFPITLMGDLNFDGEVNEQDWSAFLAGNQTDLSGLSEREAYALGDLDRDYDNDGDDFFLFRAAFEEANPAPGAFEAMVAAHAVPEPSTLAMLAVLGLVGICLRWRRTA